MAKVAPLDTQLSVLTDELVEQIMASLRDAALSATPQPARQPTKAQSSARGRGLAPPVGPLAAKIIKALREMGTPMDVPTLAADLSLAPSRLTAALRELRAAGKVKKYGTGDEAVYALE